MSWLSLACRAPNSCPIVDRAGSMVSVDRATRAIMEAVRATNSPKRRVDLPEAGSLLVWIIVQKVSRVVYLEISGVGQTAVNYFI